MSGPLGVHRDQRQAGAEPEPGELLAGLTGEASLQMRAGAHQPGHDGGHGDRAAAEFGAQPFGESDGSGHRGDRHDPAVVLTTHDRQRGERQANRSEGHRV